jgi:hypothetical protein
MWCPDGYLRWDEFRETCREAARKFLDRRYGVLKDRAEGDPVDPSVEGPYARKSKKHALANFLMSDALMEGILSCVSASGQPVRIQTKNFAPLVFADDKATKEIVCSDTSPWRPTDWDEAPPAWWRVWERPLYLFIDDETGTILSPSEAALKNFGDKFTAQYDYAGHGVPDTPATRDDLKGWLHHALADARALAAQFEGQALCIKIDAADQFTGSAFDDWKPEQVPAVGSGVDDAYRSFKEKYPNGRGSATWEEVERVLGWSRRQIERGIKKFEG